jgi:hypothetical protein
MLVGDITADAERARLLAHDACHTHLIPGDEGHARLALTKLAHQRAAEPRGSAGHRDAQSM